MPKLSTPERLAVFAAVSATLQQMRGAYAEESRLIASGVLSCNGEAFDRDFWPAHIAPLAAAEKKLASVLS